MTQKIGIMTEIIAEDATGTSKKSLTRALAEAIKSALKTIDGTHQLNITVVVEGVTYENGEYKVNVKVLIMDITMEQQKAYHESQKEFMDRMNSAQDLSDQMVSAIYSRPVYDDSNPVDSLEQRMDSMSDKSNNFDFDVNEDNINLVAPQNFHDQLREDYKAQFVKNEPTISPQTLDFGGGGFSPSNDKDAA